MLIFRLIFFGNYWWQKSDIWSHASYRYPISWKRFWTHQIPESSNLTGPNMLPTIWHTYMKLVTKYQIPVINSCFEKCDEKCAYYWWQRSAIWSQASYGYPISWESFFDPSDSYFLFVEERGYHKWALAQAASKNATKNVHIQMYAKCE
jgi:hypothetical protein